MDALESDSRALDIINRMTELFAIEYEYKERKLSNMERKQYRLKHSQPIAIGLYAAVKTLSKMSDCSILLKKALHYFFTE